ncbi:putative multistep phosphorelay regulator 1 [Kockiozyma suomiensis]|uniref:putative multistep phosphorelay regulator 1 n=1 Tax=Kockiozyma suomiensis TaxID=1337062 RepID=UPI003343DD2C
MDSLECLTADHFDLDTFSQILEMDDSEEDRDFSRGIVYGYFEQAENTLESMQTGLVEKDFESLNQLSHFLKGSAATLGLWRIRDGCEKIQNLSAGRHLHNPRDEAADNKAFEEITSLVNETVIESGTCETLLRKFYEGSN